MSGNKEMCGKFECQHTFNQNEAPMQRYGQMYAQMKKHWCMLRREDTIFIKQESS